MLFLPSDRITIWKWITHHSLLQKNQAKNQFNPKSFSYICQIVCVVKNHNLKKTIFRNTYKY